MAEILYETSLMMMDATNSCIVLYQKIKLSKYVNGVVFCCRGLDQNANKVGCLFTYIEKEQTCLPGGGGGRWPLDDLLLCWCFS